MKSVCDLDLTLVTPDLTHFPVVHLTNSLTMNGTSLHFHGIRQFETSDQDGVASITQCPTAVRYFRPRLVTYADPITAW